MAALGQELRRHKPLLPVITRSDYFEEDEVDGNICQVLFNKKTDQRYLQEADVHTRAIAQLIDMQVDPALLHSPISTSSQMLKNAAFDDKTMQSAGFNHFFDALLHFIEPTLIYKQHKPAETVLHHLQEKILMPLQLEVVPKMHQLQQYLDNESSTLAQHKEEIVKQIWRSMIEGLPNLLRQYSEQQALSELYSILTQQAEQLLSKQISSRLVDYQLCNIPIRPLQFSENLSYEVIYSHDGKEILAIGHERLYNEISQDLWQQLDHYTDQIIAQCQKILTNIQEQIKTIQQDLINDEQELKYISRQLRMTDLAQV